MIVSPVQLGVFFILENWLVGYSDDSTLIEVVPLLGVRIAVPEFLNRDLFNVSEWCDLRGMKLNASMTKLIIASKSRTMHPQSSPLTIGGTVLKKSDDLDIFRVSFHSMPDLLLRSIIARFPQLLKDLVS